MANLCPKCARPLDVNSYCSHCDLSVSVYNRIKDMSKILYNQGLQKAKVRDLSASIDLLNRSVRLNKHNTDARNLLGLIYFEIGETVSALQHWVISKNLKPQDNEAVYFLNQVQDNQSYLDKLNTAIKKYNQALGYINQDSVDLAIIQLKKVTSLNPKYVKAYALLSLCYIKDGHIDKAKKVLFKIQAIDKSNYVARKYLDRLEQQAVTSEHFRDESAKESPIRSFRPSPLNTKVSNAMFQFIAMAIGIAIGLAIMSFMVMPGRIDQKNTQINEMTAELIQSEETIDTLEDEVNRLEAELTNSEALGEAATKASQNKEKQLKETVKVLNAMNSLVVQELEREAADTLYLVDATVLSADVNAIYESLTSVVYPTIAQSTHNSGYNAYSTNRLEEAIELLTTSYKFAKDADYSSRTLYFLARSYQKLGQTDQALPLFKSVVTEYPESSYADDAQYFIGQLE